MKQILLFILMSVGITSLVYSQGENKEMALDINTQESTIEWIGEKITGKHNGTVSLKSGQLMFNDGLLIGGSITMDMTSITVDDLQGEWGNKLLGHLKSDDFFSVSNYNTAYMEITNVDYTDDIAHITAELEIKGITQPITFQSTFEDNSAQATIVIDRTKYDIKYGSGKFFDNLGDKTISDEFKLIINLVY